jgi:hypothetical protein
MLVKQSWHTRMLASALQGCTTSSTENMQQEHVMDDVTAPEGATAATAATSAAAAAVATRTNARWASSSSDMNTSVAHWRCRATVSRMATTAVAFATRWRLTRSGSINDAARAASLALTAS